MIICTFFPRGLHVGKAGSKCKTFKEYTHKCLMKLGLQDRISEVYESSLLLQLALKSIPLFFMIAFLLVIGGFIDFLGDYPIAYNTTS